MSAERGDRLAECVAERELDLALVSNLVNVRYLTGFGGTNGACVCGGDLRLFFTDFRYTERAEAEVEGWEIITVAEDWLGGIAERLSGRTGFEDEHLSVRTKGRLEEKLPDGVELVAAGGDVERLRRVKDADELRAIRAASELADDVWRWCLERGLGGRTERDVARAAEARIRELGAEPSFPAIVAGGPNGALPHAEPGERAIVAGDLVVFDMGAKLDDYCSDGTRTYAVGEPSDPGRDVYEVVLGAQRAALEAVRAGIGGESLDAVARDAIEAAGHGERFGHGLGHGVGLEVHEGPRVSRRSEDVLAAGEVVTIEPGVYLQGELGVRIEDLVVVTEDGCENLSSLPKDLQVVD
ncbi:MAG TPA: Xaa-Pro peptidase family protein [Solirubrobacterales bacterium]|jgi:Xaa-Pro aminopeptidase|nr:Xaa-Pro peptidase family protein [Solirubrobacterales bacterium]